MRYYTHSTSLEHWKHISEINQFASQSIIVVDLIHRSPIFSSIFLISQTNDYINPKHTRPISSKYSFILYWITILYWINLIPDTNNMKICTANILHSSQSSSFFILNALLHTVHLLNVENVSVKFINLHFSQSLSLISFIAHPSSVLSFFICQTNDHHQSESRKTGGTSSLIQCTQFQ